MSHTVTVIETSQDHARAVERLEKLILAGREQDAPLMDALSLLIEDYEQRMFPIEAADPVDVIRFRMQQKGWSQAELAQKTSMGRNRISEILNRKRGLSFAAIRALHTHLEIPLDVLFVAEKQDNEHDSLV